MNFRRIKFEQNFSQRSKGHSFILIVLVMVPQLSCHLIYYALYLCQRIFKECEIWQRHPGIHEE